MKLKDLEIVSRLRWKRLASTRTDELVTIANKKIATCSSAETYLLSWRPADLSAWINLLKTCLSIPSIDLRPWLGPARSSWTHSSPVSLELWRGVGSVCMWRVRRAAVAAIRAAALLFLGWRLCWCAGRWNLAISVVIRLMCWCWVALKGGGCAFCFRRAVFCAVFQCSIRWFLIQGVNTVLSEIFDPNRLLGAPSSKPINDTPSCSSIPKSRAYRHQNADENPPQRNAERWKGCFWGLEYHPWRILSTNCCEYTWDQCR